MALQHVGMLVGQRAHQGLGARVETVVFPEQGHWETGESLASAMGFLRRAEQPDLPGPRQN